MRDVILSRIKKQKQAFRHDPANGVYGDCYRTSIACVLGIDRDEVPHFANFADDNAGTHTELARQWLYTRNLTLCNIAFMSDPPDVLHVMGHMNPLTPYILCGMGRSGVNHCVVAFGNEIVWDPSLVDSSVIARADDGYTWVELIVRLPE